jgi:dTMP kinase
MKAARGLLVSLDGPGGVGKTTTAAHLVRLLADRGHSVHAARQPSADQLGMLARIGTYTGRALACLVAADRYRQLDQEIRPALAAGKIVVCDRYVASSYVLQRMDGVPVEFIEALNASADQPDLAVILVAPPTTTSARIDERGTRHRFENGLATSAEEADLYLDTTVRLRAAGWPLYGVDTSSTAPEQVAERIATRLALLTAPS